MSRVSLTLRNDNIRLLTITGGYSSELMATIKSHSGHYDRIVVGHGEWPSLDFLVDAVPELEQLHVGSLVERIDALAALRELRFLFIGTVAKPRLDLSAMTNLNELVIEHYHSSHCGLFGLQSLRKLLLAKYSAVDCARFAELRHLEDLQLLQGTLTSLAGLERALCLQRFTCAYMRKLTDISAINLLPNLNYFALAKCPLLITQNILEQIPGAVKVRRLIFQNENSDLVAVPKEFGGQL